MCARSAGARRRPLTATSCRRRSVPGFGLTRTSSCRAQGAAPAVARIQALVERDIAELLPTLESLASQRLAGVQVELAKRGDAEARLLAELLERQRLGIAQASAAFDPDQPGVGDEERRERAADRRHWQSRLARLEQEIRTEPGRIRASYDVHAHRLEPVGLVYLWPRRGDAHG